MSKILPGEIVGFVQVDDGGAWRTVAIAATRGGAVVGVLTAPQSGGRGQLGFEPVPELQQALAGHEMVAAAEALGGQHLAGVDPNDPRGLRGGRKRAPGMKS